MPPTAARRLRDNPPALGDLRLQGRDAAPSRCGKIDDGRAAARRLRDDLTALGLLQFEGRNAAPENCSKIDDGTHHSKPIMVNGGELQLANAPCWRAANDSRARQRERSAHELPPGRTALRASAASCRNQLCDKTLAQLCRNCIEL